MEPNYAIEVAGLTKRFGQVQALNDLSLRVPSGIIYGLLGPNGSGKTTLIRLLAGLLRPDSGRVRVLGHNVPSTEVRREVGYMTQSDALYLDLTVQENMRFFATVFGVLGQGPIMEALRVVNLEERKDSVASTLSGGMRRRLSLAAALVHKPRLLLLDEPTVGVDPQLRVTLWHQFRQLNLEGVTILVSSHVMDEAERCDRLGLLREGRLLAEGTAQELRERAANIAPALAVDGQTSLEDAFLAFEEASHVAT
jgi:ABC-2 type transport system ATP-binding protein